eukprot:jgi/Astpho2/4647/e_gw1.00067.351.1_t
MISCTQGRTGSAKCWYISAKAVTTRRAGAGACTETRSTIPPRKRRWCSRMLLQIPRCREPMTWSARAAGTKRQSSSLPVQRRA